MSAPRVATTDGTKSIQTRATILASQAEITVGTLSCLGRALAVDELRKQAVKLRKELVSP